MINKLVVLTLFFISSVAYSQNETKVKFTMQGKCNGSEVNYSCSQGAISALLSDGKWKQNSSDPNHYEYINTNEIDRYFYERFGQAFQRRAEKELGCKMNGASGGARSGDDCP